MVPLARALQRAGHDVAWAIAASSCPGIAKLGFVVHAAGIDARERERRLAALPPPADVPPRQRRPGMLTRLFAATAAPPMLDDLRPLIDRLEPDVVVHEPCEFAAAPVAASRGIPHVTVGFGRLLSPALLAAAAQHVATLWHAVGLEAAPQAGLYDHLYLHPLPEALEPTPDATTLHRMRPLGFDGADDGDEAPAWLEEFGRDRPGLYVTFGTVFGGGAPWEAVLSAARALDVDVLLTVGPHGDPSRVSHRSEPRVRAERYVPQRAVLARAAMLASHTGSGAMIGAASAGIPQLCLPIAADQFENSDAVVASGAGLALDPHQVEPAAVRVALERLRDDPDLVRAARTLRAAIAALPHPDEVVALVEAAGSRAAR